MSGITTHVLDTSTGRPAAGVEVVLAEADGTGGWMERARMRTDEDGRAALLGQGESSRVRDYRLTFEVAKYLEERAPAAEAFYPRVEIHFTIARPEEHHHVPLLLSPYGYSTYRGS